MDSHTGSPFRAHVHSTDASSGVAVPLYKNGSASVYTLSDTEYLEVHSVDVVTLAGGDCYVNVGPTSGTDADEIVVRGTFAANGGISKTGITPAFAGKAAGTPFIVAPAGVVDVVIHGTIREATLSGVQPSYQARRGS